MKSCLKKYLTPVKYAQMTPSRNKNRKQGKIKGTRSQEIDIFFDVQHESKIFALFSQESWGFSS